MWPLVSLKSGSSLTQRDPNFSKTSGARTDRISRSTATKSCVRGCPAGQGQLSHEMSITLKKELHVAAQQASVRLAMANMHVMYDTQRACSPSLITRNVDHFEKRAARGRPASQLSLSDGQYARDVWYTTCMFAIANHTKCRSLWENSCTWPPSKPAFT